MKRKGTKRGIMVMLVAAMLLMATGVTSFAAWKQNTNVYGEVVKWGQVPKRRLLLWGLVLVRCMFL
ncbi:MAG: hypothetical protein HFI66_08910 [Lachnospiraceae bacterium]|nr:hypothetical protein [Lachnospiraceae bacterium]